jgi:hypothetical protein
MSLAKYLGMDETVGKYERVIPRDLFNEAKLLKCMGRLCLLIHSNKTPVKMSFKQPKGGFNIQQLSSDGALIITNLPVKIKSETFYFVSKYNSKANYPLYLRFENEDTQVFDESGEFTTEFIAFCKKVRWTE